MTLDPNRFGAAWVVNNIERRVDGRLDVTYSLAPSYTYIATVVPGNDLARAIKVTGDYLSQIYKEQGYL